MAMALFLAGGLAFLIVGGTTSVHANASGHSHARRRARRLEASDERVDGFVVAGPAADDDELQREARTTELSTSSAFLDDT